MKSKQDNHPLPWIFGPQGILARNLPDYEDRPQQIRMMEAITDALSESSHLVVEAGTGTGKTLAYLIPAIQSGKRVVISTGTKNLQEQIYYKDIAFLRDTLGRPFKAVLLKGKNNYLCLYRFRQFSLHPLFATPDETAYYDKLITWSQQTRTGDRAELIDLPENLQVWSEITVGEGCLGTSCPDYDACHITRLRQEAASADLIVVNHHLFFADLSLRQQAYGEVLPRYHAVIFDEAHKIEEVATQHFGLSLSNYRLDELIRDARRELQGVIHRGSILPEASYLDDWEVLLQAGSRAADNFFATLRKAVIPRDNPGSPGMGRETYPAEEIKKLWTVSDWTSEPRDRHHHLLDTLSRISRHLQKAETLSEGIGTLVRRSQEIQNDLSGLLVMNREDWVTWIEVRSKGVFLRSSPLDLTETLREHLLDKVPTIIFTSATLSVNHSVEYFKSRCGIEASEDLILDSPFDFASQARVYLPAKAPDPNGPEFVPFLVREITEILTATQGRAFVLFTSYKNLAAVYSLVTEQSRGPWKFPIYRQGSKPRSQLLRDFQAETHSVLFATSSFWEGVDVPGESLSCVIIDRLPFAPPQDPMVAARLHYLKKQGRDPFYDHQVPEAVLSLKQGLGRLIRTRSDRGVMAVLDGRIRTKGYGRFFLNSLPPCPITSNREEIQDFLNAPHSSK